ncbi:SRPBCC family protein [Geodermatophilus sp. TF02-6]|uniref:SRPBCC family protein n=1 Tax=Geodermatophilus sp. TF02-6 TaxID=2250575 RepID=UPI000DEA3AB5|nr:SRPBCC family protein [Geodermatophilus sp. TF02-6]RBY79519.1 SRPBCC family protein [Geodermatophilus sp. TF02-6]
MRELVETVDVDAPPERVWAALTDWTRQGEWMLATDVEVVGGDPHAVGGRLAARTGLPWRGGRHLGVLDTMVITEWDPPRRVVVQHTGRVVRGPGIFEVVPRGAGATLVWTERLELPFGLLGLLGRLGWPVAEPAVVAGVRRSLRRFAAFAARHPG